MIYNVYMQKTKQEAPVRCEHMFDLKEQANLFAKTGARNCQCICIVMKNGKEISRFDFRPN